MSHHPQSPFDFDDDDEDLRMSQSHHHQNQGQGQGQRHHHHHHEHSQHPPQGPPGSGSPFYSPNEGEMFGASPVGGPPQMGRQGPPPPMPDTPTAFNNSTRTQGSNQLSVPDSTGFYSPAQSMHSSADEYTRMAPDPRQSQQPMQQPMQPSFQQQQQMLQPPLPNKPGFGYQQPNYAMSSSGIFQTFERDFDEPVIDQLPDFVTDAELMKDERNRSSVSLVRNEAGAEKVKLLNGKYYSFDYPVPKKLLQKIPFPGAKDLAEFKYVRYHAVTADPKDYRADNPAAREYIENYPLRQKWYAVPRETELMIVCTMYNEDEVLLARTLKGVFKNIKTMYNMKSLNQPFGKNAWKRVVVVIVSDGRNKLNERSKSLLTLLGCYQDGIIQEKVNDKEVKAHLFEYTTSFGIGKFKYDSRNSDGCRVPLVADQTVPIQLMFLLKERNAQKINSHRWALNFLCPNLRPKTICLIDVGTEPGPDSIFKLWEAFKDPKVAGVCGEIRCMLGRHASANDVSSVGGKMKLWIVSRFSDLWACIRNPLVAAQNFEYKMSNILDKPTESFFGFVSVLPGAFSAYRYTALQGDPLEAYFHGEDMKSDTEKPAGVLESNMYLAEDRILCYQLVSKPHCAYLLRYVHDAYAVTDVPGSVNEFMNQRRRWLNGSFFAALYSILRFYRILNCSHGLFRKLMLIFEMIYQFIGIILSWFGLATYFLIFRIVTLQVIDTSMGYEVGNILAVVFLWVYIATAVLAFILSFGNKPNESKHLYELVFVMFGIVGIYLMVCVVWLTVSSIQTVWATVSLNQTVAERALAFLRNNTFRDLTISLSSTYLLYIFGSLLFMDCFHLVACTLQYVLLSPAYINMLTIFAFCNIDDISWGTKGALKVEGPKKQANVGKADGELLLSEALKDPDEMYDLAQKELNSADSGADNNKSNSKQSETNYARGRTYTVILWLASNFALLVVVLRTGGMDEYVRIRHGERPGTADSAGTSVNDATATAARLAKRLVSSYISKRDYDALTASYFMKVILWLVAGMALFRFCACVFYRINFFARRRRYHKAQVYY